MPLEHGLASVDLYSLKSIPLSVWPVLLANKEFILDVFRDYPERLSKPYEYSVRVDYSGSSCITSIDYYNHLPKQPFASILDKLNNQSLLADALTIFPDRLRIGKFIANKNDIDAHAYAQQYALTDLLIVFVILLNHYVSDQSQFISCYNNFFVNDALGRPIETRVITEIERVLKRRNGRSDNLPVARYILEIVKVSALHEPKRFSNDGRNFELECANLLSSNQYRIERTSITGDFGADLIAIRFGLGFAIQCKNTLRPVGVKAIQEAVAARAHYGVDFAVICSSGGFTNAAMSLAATTGAITCNAVNLVRCLEVV